MTEIETKTEHEEKKPEAPTASIKGLIGTKVGMTRVFVSETQMVPVTIVSSDGLIVSLIKKKETDGYNAVQLAYGDVLERKLSKAEALHFSKKGLPLKRHLMEFRVDDVSSYQAGQSVPVTNFQKGDLVLASGFTKGKGFTGTIKRWGFHGGPNSHGHSEYRRSPGSSGAQGPQHVIPGTKKPGHKGNVWYTAQSLEVVDVLPEKSLILLRGSVPGHNGTIIMLRPSPRKKRIAQAQAKHHDKKQAPPAKAKK